MYNHSKHTLGETRPLS